MLIKITCEGAASVPLDSLKNFQGNLKTLDERQFLRLRRSIEKHGFSFPVSVWRDGDECHIIDGHQRLFILTKMLEEDCELEGDIPVDWIEAEDVKEAKEKVLLAASQYGRYDEDSLYEFIKFNELEYPELKLEIDLPQIDMGKFEVERFSDEGFSKEGSGEDEGEEARLYSYESIAELAYKHFRKIGFPYIDLPLFIQTQEVNKLAGLSNEAALKSTVGGSVIDTYHRHRYKLSAHGMLSPLAAFESNKLLKKAISFSLEYGGRISEGILRGKLEIVSGVQACANFKPAYAMCIYRTYALKGGTVLDPSAGFGGRMLGWHVSEVGGKYIGVDPSTKTHIANMAMSKALGFDASVSLTKIPFEDFDIKQIKNKVDLVFTSPPYFNKESYSDEETQSCVRYGDLRQWVEKFLKVLIQKSFQALKKKKCLIINIADIKLGNRICSLEKMSIEIAKETGFVLEATLDYGISERPGGGHEPGGTGTKNEPVFVFRKE